MTTDLLLGLDVGTTSCKAALVTPAGEEIAHGRTATPWRTVPTGAEIDPRELLASVLAAARQALAAAPGARVAAVGVASLAETGVLLGAAGEPVAPSIAWYDSRGDAQAAELVAELGAERFSGRTGLTPRPLCGLVKYRWLRDNDAGAARGVRWLSVGEWIVHALGGDQVGELSLASRTGWLDLRARGWWDEALAWARAPAGLLPEPLVAGTPAGTAGDAFPEARGAVLAVGGHDHLSAAVGAGATADGDVLDSWGTAEAFVRAAAPVPAGRVAATVADGIAVGWHVVEGRQCLLGALRSGAALQRVLELLGVAPGDRAELERAALRAAAGAEPCVVIRGLEVEGDPLVEVAPQAAPGVVWRAALERVTRAGEEVLDRMDRVAGPRARLVLAGGWAEGEAALAVKRARHGHVERTDAVYVGARGAALTAARAAGAASC